MPKLYQNEEWLEKKYWKEKLNTYQIAKLCKVDATIIRRQMKKFSIPIRSESEAQLLRYKENQQNKKYCNKKWLQKKYLKEKLSTIKIAKLCGVCHETIRNWLKRFDILHRSRGEANHLRQVNYCSLSQEAIEWINGELLGDGNLCSRSSYSSTFRYGSKYPEYIQYISNTLNSFGIKQSGRIHKKYHKKYDCYTYHYESYYYKELLPIYKKWYPKGKRKIIPRDVELTPITLRQHYIGDGSLANKGRGRPFITLCTCGFTISDVTWLIRKLIKLGFRSTRRPSDNTIGISSHSTKNFLDYIGSCPVSCYQYKWAMNKM